MAQTLSPETLASLSAIAYVPNSPKAFSTRGYDHMELVANDLGRLLHLPVWNVFERPRSIDQRGLDRAERQTNMEKAFHLRDISSEANANNVKSLLLIDDVYTTGATMMAARQALLQAFDAPVFGLTFARVV